MRSIILGVALVASAIVMIAVAMIVFTSEPTSVESEAVAPLAPTGAAAKPTPEAEAEAAIPPHKRHTTLSNVRMLQPLEKKDFSKVAPPLRQEPADDESQ